MESKNFENVEYKIDDEYEFYKVIKLKFVAKGDKQDIGLNLIYSEINEGVILINEADEIISIISIDDDNIKFYNELDEVIKEIYCFIPKKHTIYKCDEIYNISSTNQYGKILFNKEKFIVIISEYLKLKDKLN